MRCAICPRRCGAERTGAAGGGLCGMPALPVVARAALHRWEEPPISGTRGAGTVFFSGCSLRCVFCQNDEISRGGHGRPVTVQRLREIFRELIAQGAHNIDLVTPTHFAPAIREALEEPLPVPVVWNSGGYELPETLRTLEGKVDVWLPDLKYLDREAAARYSGAADYPERATAAILEMYRQAGPLMEEDGLLRRGVVIRHLLLPGGLARAKQVMDWVARQFPPGAVYFSLMGQYTPYGRAEDYPEINRTLRRAELRAAREYMANIGLAGFVQDLDSVGREYTPAFDLTGV